MQLHEILSKYGKGKGESQMNEISVLLSDYIAETKDTNKKEYWYLLRKIYGILSGGHYNEDFAKHDVEQMQPLGEFWSMKQVEDATKNMSFPTGTTLCDKFVAFNATKNDLNTVITDEDIIKVAYAFWFKDQDWGNSNKIWDYFCCKYTKKSP